MKPKDNIFSTPDREGIERPAVLIIFPGCDARYLCYRWGRFSDHWLLELVNGDQVEVYQMNPFIHVPRQGFTFQLDGTVREVQRTSVIEVVQ